MGNTSFTEGKTALNLGSTSIKRDKSKLMMGKSSISRGEEHNIPGLFHHHQWQDEDLHGWCLLQPRHQDYVLPKGFYAQEEDSLTGSKAEYLGRVLGVGWGGQIHQAGNK